MFVFQVNSRHRRVSKVVLVMRLEMTRWGLISSSHLLLKTVNLLLLGLNIQKSLMLDRHVYSENRNIYKNLAISKK